MPPLSHALADTILARYPDPDTIPYQAWCYVQGYVLIGLEKLWLASKREKYFAYLKRFADQHVAADGSLTGFSGVSLDDMMAGAVIAALYQHTREEKYRLAAQRIRASFADYPRNSDGGFWHGRQLPGEMWIDGVFMGGMFLTRYGAAVAEQETCFAEVAHQILTFAGHCRKGDSGLYLHGYDERRSVFWADPQTGLSPEVWSEGLGWYALMLADFLAVLPAQHPQRPALLQILRELAAGLKRVQDERSGLWYQVVDKGRLPDNWVDTSGSGMFLYMFQRAVDQGWIERAAYQPVIERGYAGLKTKAVANAEGLVDILDACDGVCVQKSYADYVDFPRVLNAKEAVGSVLWASIAIDHSS
jgi:unsaturated rhamnogalacturonyl hydrolase